MRSSYKAAMRHMLHCHPDTPSSVVTAIEATVSRGKSGNLLLHYYVTGDPKRLRPDPWQPQTRQRVDELWQHTCFEAFVRPHGGEGYVEFNFSPTHDWQAYRLSGYRAGRHPIEAIAAPAVETVLANDAYELRAHLALAGVVADVPWRLGLSAVIEDIDGAISYWALRHALEKPDFHHDSAFALDLPVSP